MISGITELAVQLLKKTTTTSQHDNLLVPVRKEMRKKKKKRCVGNGIGLSWTNCDKHLISC